MTYFGVLGTFILPPILILALWTWYDDRRGVPLVKTNFLPRYGLAAVGLHALIALIYTTPWDNYLVASEVWWYDPTLVTGIRIGYVPIEEYTFFILQSIFSGLLLLFLSRYVFTQPPHFMPNLSLRLGVSLCLGLLWLIFIALLIWGGESARYLSLIMVWALPPLIIQSAFGADILFGRWKFVATAILLPSLYLNLVDTLAIQSGTWIISPSQTTGIMIGILPIEEAVFFTITNVLLVWGITLMLASESQPRLQAFMIWIKPMIRKTALFIVLMIFCGYGLLFPLEHSTATPPTDLITIEGRLVKVDNINVYVVEAGDSTNPTVVLLHGFGASTFSWRYQIPALVEAGYQVIAYDRPGFGLSDKPIDFNYTMASQADFAIRLLDELGIEKATFVGHSQGGNVALHIALQHPQRVEKLALLAAAVTITDDTDTGMLAGLGSGIFSLSTDLILQLPAATEVASAVLQIAFNPTIRAAILRTAYANPELVTDDVIAGYDQTFTTVGWEEALLAMIRDNGGAFNLDSFLGNPTEFIWQADDSITPAEVATLDYPTLLLWGSADTWVPLETAFPLSDNLPDSTFKIYPDIGHMLMEETPESVNADLLLFLETQ